MSQPSETSTLDFLASMKRPLKWAISAGLVTAVGVIFMPNYYRSDARLLPVESKSAGGNLGGLASAAAAFGFGVPGGDSNDANFVDILNSRWLREQLLQTEFHYHVRSWRFGAERLVKKTLYDHLKAKNIDGALQSLSSVLSASRDIKSRVISVSAESTSPELSQQVTERAVKLLEIFNQEKGRTRGGAKAAFAEARLADAREEMDEAEATFLRFLETNRNYQTSSDPAVRLKGARLETELRLRQQLVSSIAMNREQALLEEKNDIPILNVLDHGNLPVLKSSPVRSTYVELAMILIGFGSWGWFNREWLKTKLFANDEPPISAQE